MQEETSTRIKPLCIRLDVLASVSLCTLFDLCIAYNRFNSAHYYSRRRVINSRYLATSLVVHDVIQPEMSGIPVVKGRRQIAFVHGNASSRAIWTLGNMNRPVFPRRPEQTKPSAANITAIYHELGHATTDREPR